MTKKEIFEEISAKKEVIRGFGVSRIGLFGSYARGVERQESDVDVLVEFNQKSFDNYMGLKFFLEELFNKKVDLVLADSLKPQLKPQILKEAVYVPGV